MDKMHQIKETNITLKSKFLRSTSFHFKCPKNAPCLWFGHFSSDVKCCTHTCLQHFTWELKCTNQSWRSQKVAFSKWCCLLIQCTLVYQINMQHNLLTFWKIPTCTALFYPACIFTKWIYKNSILHALFHPAHFINFGKFSILHYYLID